MRVRVRNLAHRMIERIRHSRRFLAWLETQSGLAGLTPDELVEQYLSKGDTDYLDIERQDLSGGGGGGGTGGGPVTPTTFNPLTDAQNIILIGASLIDRADDEVDNADYMAQAFANMGYVGNLDWEATAGDTFTHTLDHLDNNLIPEYTGTGDQQFVIMHRSGNDVTNDRPYDVSQQAAFLANLEAIADRFDSIGMRFAPANISKRFYTAAPTVNWGDAASEANGSLPYNENCVHPFIQSRAPDFWDDTNGVPKLDAYDFIDRHNFLVTAGDGTHLDTGTDGGYAHMFPEWLLYQVKRMYDDDARADSAGKTFVFSIRDSSEELPTTGGVNRFVEFTSLVKDTTGTPCRHLAVEMTGSLPAGNGAGANAVVSDSDLSPWQTMYTYAAANATVSRKTSINVTHMGFPSGATGNLILSASRSATGTARRGDVVVQGVSAGVLDAATDAASNELGPIPFTVDSNGEIQIDITIASGSTFAYLTAWKIIMD